MAKEVEAYEKEVIHNEGRIQKMRDDGKDEYGRISFLLTFLVMVWTWRSNVIKMPDIRKQEEVLQESYMMVPDSKARYEAAISELESLVDASAEDAEVEEALRTEARAIVEAYRLA